MHPRLALIADGLSPDGASGEPPEAWWEDHTRVAAVETGVAPAAAPAPALPVPGRHAARRRVRLVPRGLPSLAPAHVAIVAVAVAVGLAITAWWIVRDQPVPGAAAPTAAGATVEPLLAGASSSGSPGRATGEAGATEGTVTVDVAGKVRRPGIVVLDQGARVTDALSAAGGPRRGVDLMSLNLARVLVDGEQIVVGAPAGAAPPGGSGGGGVGTSGSAGPLVNLNLASQAELESLPQVGPVTAQSIIAWRDQHGGFTSIDELLEVDGIGQKTLDQLAPHVTV